MSNVAFSGQIEAEWWLDWTMIDPSGNDVPIDFSEYGWRGAIGVPIGMGEFDIDPAVDRLDPVFEEDFSHTAPVDIATGTATVYADLGHLRTSVSDSPSVDIAAQASFHYSGSFVAEKSGQYTLYYSAYPTVDDSSASTRIGVTLGEQLMEDKFGPYNGSLSEYYNEEDQASFGLLFDLGVTSPYDPSSPPPPPQNYGLFIGADSEITRPDKTTSTYLGSTAAKNLRDKIAATLGLADQETLTADLRKGESIQVSDIQAAIDNLGASMNAGDRLYVYMTGHGNYEDTGIETTLTPGNEFVYLGSKISDDDMTTLLGGLPDIEKWVFIDSCSSGGYWGDNNANDIGDLDKLSNIALAAASSEYDVRGITDTSGYDGTATGLPYFGTVLETGLDIDLLTGKYWADIDTNGEILFSELADYVKNYSPLRYKPWMQYTEWHELASGDPWSIDQFGPAFYTSDDFTGGRLSNTQVPTPSSLLLVTLGICLLKSFRRNTAV